MSTEGEESGIGYTDEAIEEKEENVFCFLNQDRLCLPTCIAYNTNLPETPPKELSPAQQRCSLLCNAERSSRHLVILTSVMASIDKRQKNETADRKREMQVPIAPPNPFGSKS